MMKSLLRALTTGLLVLAPALSFAQVTLKDDAPDVYYVKNGDNLWNIASQFLDSPWQWPELWHVNQEIENPHLIYPGDVIRIVYVDGKPRIEVERNGGADDGKETVKMMTDGRLVKMEPKARVVALDTAIPAIPLDTVENYLVEGLVLSKLQLEQAPYVVGGEDARVVFGDGDTVYARDPVDAWENLVRSYGIYRVGEEYVDPVTKEILGYEALEIALARVADQESEIATLRLIQSNEDVREQDRVLNAAERKMQSVFYPVAPDEAIDARVIRFFDRLNSVARNEALVINKGIRDGLRAGHVLEVKQAGQVVKDKVRDEMIQLPQVKAGTIIVFRAFEKVSYALVVEAERPIRMNDIATNPAGSL